MRCPKLKIDSEAICSVILPTFSLTKQKPLIEHPHIKLEKGDCHQEKVVWVRFVYNREIIGLLKERIPAHWSATNKCWYIVEKYFNLHQFYEIFNRLVFVDYSVFKKTSVSKETAQRQIKISKGKVEIPQKYFDALDQKRCAKNTEIYTHVSNSKISEIKNPIDDLFK